jgi:diguanylate cyclase (GGDEF)-like protein
LDFKTKAPDRQVLRFFLICSTWRDCSAKKLDVMERQKRRLGVLHRFPSSFVNQIMAIIIGCVIEFVLGKVIDLRAAQQNVDASISMSTIHRGRIAAMPSSDHTFPLDLNAIDGTVGAEQSQALSQQDLSPQVRTTLAQMQAQINSLRAERARLSQRLREAEDLADTDTLVPVFNRRAFVRELTRVMSFAQRYDVQASLVYFDLDGFKQVNDRFGHPAGDAVLKAIGQVLLTHIRESDLAGRVGGDEFAVILAKSSLHDAQVKGAQLAKAIRNTTIPYLGHSLNVGAAFGAYCFGPGDTAERALSRADEAMYANKVGRKVQSL